MRRMLAAVALLATLLAGYPAQSAADWSWIKDVEEWQCTWSVTYSLDSTQQDVNGTVTWKVDASASGASEVHESIQQPVEDTYYVWDAEFAPPTFISGAYHAYMRTTSAEGWHGGSSDSTAFDSFEDGPSLAVDLRAGTYDVWLPHASFVTRDVQSDSFLGDVVSTGMRQVVAGYGMDPDNDPMTHIALPATGRVLEGTYQIPNWISAGGFFSELVTGTVHYRFTPLEEPRSVRITRLEQQPKSKAAGATDFAFSKGRLVLYAEARVSPPDRASLVQWDVPSIGESVQKVDTRKVDRRNGIAKLTVTYTGLPASNDAFGAKTLRARLADGGTPLQDEKDLRVFFRRDGRDHPPVGESVPGEPNWYYYWKQGPVPRLSEFKFDPKSTGAKYDPEAADANAFTIGRDATTPFGPLTLQLSTDIDNGHAYTLQRDHVEGIQAVAAAVRHELTHAALFRRAKQDQVDPDRDGIVLDHEMDAATYPPWTYWDRANTYGITVDVFFGGDSKGWIRAARSEGDAKWRRGEVTEATKQLKESGDNEMKAIASEKTRSADPSRDWAYPGSQAPGK